MKASAGWSAPRSTRSRSYERIWQVVARIPPGCVATYGQVARLAGLPHQARLAGYALHALPAGMPIPWHRVINARGRISFPKASAMHAHQQELLRKEGIPYDGGIDLTRWGWDPKRPSR